MGDKAIRAEGLVYTSKRSKAFTKHSLSKLDNVPFDRNGIRYLTVVIILCRWYSDDINGQTVFKQTSPKNKKLVMCFKLTFVFIYLSLCSLLFHTWWQTGIKWLVRNEYLRRFFVIEILFNNI